MAKVIAEDPELELWKEEWREEGGPLPAVKRLVGRQTLRMIASNVAGGAMLILILIASLRFVMRHPSPQVIVWGVAVCVFSVISAVFVVWNQVGIWQPEAQSTHAYAELMCKRAFSKIRKMRFVFFTFYAAAGFDIAYLAWTAWLERTQASIHPGDILERIVRLLCILLGFWLFLVWYKRRKTRQYEEAKGFLREIGGR